MLDFNKHPYRIRLSRRLAIPERRADAGIPAEWFRQRLLGGYVVEMWTGSRWVPTDAQVAA